MGGKMTKIRFKDLGISLKLAVIAGVVQFIGIALYLLAMLFFLVSGVIGY